MLCVLLLKLFTLQALTILTEMLRDQRSAKLRSFVLPAVGEMLCLVASQVRVLLLLCILAVMYN